MEPVRLFRSCRPGGAVLWEQHWHPETLLQHGTRCCCWTGYEGRRGIWIRSLLWQSLHLHPPHCVVVLKRYIVIYIEPKKCKSSSVCLFGDKCSRAHIIHLSLSGQSQDSLRSVSGHSRSVSGQSQALRSVLGSLRSLSGLSVLTSSDKRSLKYFVLFRRETWMLCCV